MTPDGILTALSVLVAVYAVIPRARRLDLKLRFGVVALGSVVVGVLLVVYLQLLSMFAILGWTPGRGLLSRLGLSPEQASFWVLIGCLLIAWLLSLNRRLPIRRVQRLRDLVEELLTSRSYAELIALLDTHLSRLVAFADGDVWFVRLRRESLHEGPGYTPGGEPWGEGLDDVGEVGETRLGTVSRLFQWGLRGFARCLPHRERHCEIADIVLNQLLTSRQWTAGIIANRAYFALRILELKRHTTHEFLEDYMRLLFADTSSVFYTELRRCRNFARRGGYLIPAEARLLTFLFGDARRAEHLAAWRPIGEAMIEEFDRLAREPIGDPYNRPVGQDFEDHDRWGLPLCAGLHYFDLMVSEALYQGVQWHMWLFYFPHFADRIVRNCAPDPMVELNSELPGRYAFLAYELVRCLRSWILAIQDISSDQANIRLRGESLEHETGNIPKSSILALGQCLRIFLEADTIPGRFKRSLAGMAYQAYFRLRGQCRRDDYARVLLLSLRSGGPAAFLKTPSETYRSELAAAWEEFDKVPASSEHCRDLEEALFG